MRVLQISTMCGTGSVGRIAVDLYNTIIKEGDECLICYGRGHSPENINSFKFNVNQDIYHHAIMTRLTDKTGFYSVSATKRLIDKIERFNPDVIHLHCLHGYYLNIELLFDYLKRSDKPIVWTMHDCWAFTGHCAYFDYVECEKWKTGCFECPQIHSFPSSFIDNSKWNYEKKRKIFTSVNNLTIVTPSEWLGNLVNQSFLNQYQIRVINNGINLEKFKPSESIFRVEHNLVDKFIILGVASIWDRRKGLNDIINLSKQLDEKFKVVVVGLNKEQLKKLPTNIIGITKTNNLEELVKIYSSADVFVNTTYEDNFPTTNLEALACGIPVITYNTGGSIESVNETCGEVIEKGNINQLKDAIEKIRCNRKSKKACIDNSKKYSDNERYKEYINLYKEVIK